jgi:hypothetical protein
MGVYDYKVAKKTNKTNMAINQANIDYAWKALNTQNDFNVQQWERQNAYNDPSAQMRRYLNAGLNPWNSSSSVGSGEADSLTSAQYSPPNMIPMQQPNQSRVGTILDSVQTALDGGLKVLDILKGGNTLSDTIKGTNALNQGYVLDTQFNRDTIKAKIAASNQVYKAQEYTAANEAAYQLALSKYDMNEKAATTFSNWVTSRQIARQKLENMVDNHLISKKTLEWFDKDHEASFEKQMASAGVDRQQIKRMEKELPFVVDYIKAQIAEFKARAESEHENAVDLRETRWSRNNQMNMNAFNMQQQGYGQRQQNYWFVPDARQMFYHPSKFDKFTKSWRGGFYDTWQNRGLRTASDLFNMLPGLIKFSH